MQVNFKIGKSFFLCSLLSFSMGCSVYKASSNEGVSVADIQSCKLKGCLLAKGMQQVESKNTEDGKVVEMYRAISRKTGLNYVRAAGHGVMDVMTLGLWEVAGTPIEGAISNNRNYIVARATYSDKLSEDIQTLEIYDSNGKKAK